MKQMVFSYQEAAGLPVARLGAKAAGLLRLREYGFQVPDGFCIAAAAYTHHIRNIRLPSNITAGELTHVHNAIMQAPLAPPLAAEIETHYRRLPAGLVAVRSSATAEDLPEHSFAGQYDTFLNIKTADECIEAVKKCWASLWTERAFFYRQKNSFDHSKAAMAVIVQAQVKAGSAGVVFTADPLSQDSGRIVIESCFGLGDKLVGGRVRPDRFIFEKKPLKLTQCEPAEPDQTPSLNKDLASALAESAIAIERAFGAPQDIEWAVENETFYFLQSRPITTMRGEKNFAQRQVWTNMNTAEILPDVVTPLTWSILSRLFKPLFRSVWRMLGTDLDEQIIAGLVAGRVYFNVNTGVATAMHFPAFVQRRIGIDELLGGSLKKEILSGNLKFAKEDLPDVRGSLLKFLWRIPETLYRIYHHRPSQSLRHLDELRAFGDRLRTIDPAGLSDAQLCDILHQTMKQMEELDLLFVGLALMYYPFLRLFCKKKFGDTTGNVAHQLIRGQSGMEDAQAGFDLWNLAVKAGRSPDVRQSLLSCRTCHEFAESIGKLHDGRAFSDEWNRFMEAHGHHCRGELELYNARWYEQPDYILALVKNYLAGMDKVDPVKSWNQLEHQRKELMRQCLQKLHNPVDRFRFRRTVEKTRIGLVLRENWKSYLVRIVVQMRRMVKELGARLSTNGILERAEDILFMTLEEIRPAAECNSVPNLRQTIQLRRNEYERNEKLSPPHIVVGIYHPQAESGDAGVAGADVLTGLSVCPGKVKGKAKVILRADDNEQVLPGEILVAPFTDPAWTPYFLTAAGIVMDQGGMLSHGSVVAREYGIPAVVNVGPATKIIKTGQLLEVDAHEGVVRILS